jgi:hypothetical protein
MWYVLLSASTVVVVVKAVEAEGIATGWVSTLIGDGSILGSTVGNGVRRAEVGEVASDM